MSQFLRQQTCGHSEYSSTHCKPAPPLSLPPCLPPSHPSSLPPSLIVHPFPLPRLGGVSPFLVDSLDLSQDNIRSARYSFPPRAFGEVSEPAKDMVSKLLLRDPRCVSTCAWGVRVCVRACVHACVHVRVCCVRVCVHACVCICCIFCALVCQFPSLPPPPLSSLSLLLPPVLGSLVPSV